MQQRNAIGSSDVEVEDNAEFGISEYVEFEENLKKIVESRTKFKKTKKDGHKACYIDPDILEANLKEYVILKNINKDHSIGRALGLNIIQIVEEYSKSSQFRLYYNGWNDEMKSKAYEHICKYAHGYDITYVDSCDFLIKWLFRKKIHIIKKWTIVNKISYKKFYESLPLVKIRTPNGREQFKMGRKISENDFIKLNDNVVVAELLEDGYTLDDLTFPIYDEKSFKSFVFNEHPETLLEEFNSQVKRNPFNYLTRYAYNAFITVIKDEKSISSNSQSFEENLKYTHDYVKSGDGGDEDIYIDLNTDRFDWNEIS